MSLKRNFTLILTRSALSDNSNFNFIHISFINKNINELNTCESHYFA